MQPQMGGILQVNIADRAALQSSYMAFVSGGALFIPSQQTVKLGQQMFVLATLPEQSQKIPLTGKVVWINFKKAGLKPQGFAIQLSGEKGLYYRAEAEKLLAGTMSSHRPSYTM
ncbi:PilZ domain-containing protein [Acinetobacter sp. MD2]|uniref:PilZ domain-containing protein n=1 Tax=Acinetobacter sp. MD2 TaxID=2600066 RepID=UPI002D1E5741|nr:PilZ domain-containing protein [Acinetobacter sp. MD2]MEB3766651.1 PilZ domain-containing protein [Acinetobacter sp. MD2]